MDPPLTFSLDTDANGTRVLTLVGELDIAGRWCVDGCVSDLLRSGVDRLVVDISALTFIDSSGVSSLIAAQRRMNETGGAISVRGAHGTALRALTTSGLVEYLRVQ